VNELVIKNTIITFKSIPLITHDYNIMF